MNRSVASAFRKLLSHRRNRIRKTTRQARFRPDLLALEGRILPSNFTWTGEGQDPEWSDALNWRDDNGQHGVPGANDDATISQANLVVVDGEAAVHYLSVADCDFRVTGTLTVVTGGIGNGLDQHPYDLELLGGTLKVNGGPFWVTGSYWAGNAQLLTSTSTLYLSKWMIVGGNSTISGSGLCAASVLDCRLLANLTVGHFNADDVSGAGSIFDGPGDLRITDSSVWQTVDMNGPGTLIVSNGATLVGGSFGEITHGSLIEETELLLNGRNLLNYGTVQIGDSVGAAAGIDLSSNSTVVDNESGAVLKFFGRSAVGQYYALGSLTNEGTILTVTDGVQGDVAAIDAPFQNTGTVQVQASTELDIAGGGSATGTFQVDAGGQLSFTGDQFTLNSGTSFSGNGWVAVDYNGTLDVETDVSIGYFILADNGTQEGDSNLTVTADLEWTSGTLQGGMGKTIVDQNSVMNIKGDADKTLDKRVLQVTSGGIVHWSGGQIKMTSDATNTAGIDNQQGATFSVESDAAGISADDATRCIFDNSGYFVVQNLPPNEGVGVACSFNNATPNPNVGVEVKSNFVVFEGPGVQSGIFAVWQGATIKFEKSRQTCNQGTQFQSGIVGGNPSVGSVVVTLDGTLTVAANANVISDCQFTLTSDKDANGDDKPGAVNGQGIFTSYGDFSWQAGFIQTITFDNLGVFTINGSGNRDIGSSIVGGSPTIFNNYVTIEWDRGGFTAAGVVTINNFALFNDNCDGAIKADGDALQEVIINQPNGSFVKTSGQPGPNGSKTIVGMLFQNNGLADFQGYNIEFEQKYFQFQGETRLRGGTLTVDDGAAINDGTFSAQGVIQGLGLQGVSFWMLGGTLDMGPGVGILAIDGIDFGLGDGATLAIKLGGSNPGQFDQLQFNQQANFSANSTIAFEYINLNNNWIPGAGDTFLVVAPDGNSAVGFGKPQVTFDPLLGQSTDWDFQRVAQGGLLLTHR